MKTILCFLFAAMAWSMAAQTTKIVLEDPKPYVSEDEDLMTVQLVLFQQQDSWNRGDIPAFMEAYWHSDDLLFSGAKGITYGWQNTLERYQKAYPDKAAMGKLSFEVKELRKLSKKVILMVGAWHLAREAGDLGGHFMLVWQKFGKSWFIVADHTSVLPPEE
ncbi:MAG: nuclear transport factor 2 family protein [Bacteroidetes bacterium]|nr:MAG: nuclear transport factor 2 family protein [Bacteroidota bacterium]